MDYAAGSLAEVAMKRSLLLTIAVLCFSANAFSTQSPQDSPATKEDVQKYLEVMHSRDMMAKMVDAMSKPMHLAIHEQYEKQKDKLPPDFEARMAKVLDDYMKDFPWDEMLQAMVPVYQKHFTKGDIDQLVAFYSTPTGQKLVRELPAITAEAMQAMMPIMSKSMEAMTQNLQEQVAEMVQQAQTKPAQNTPTKN